MRMHAWIAPALVLALVGTSAADAKRRGKSKTEAMTTVVVAPFVTSAEGPEYRWIGSAFSESLTDRLLDGGDAAVLSQKQWAAALREHDLAAIAVRGEADAEAIAEQLGADQYIFGRYQPRWPKVTVTAHRYAVGNKEPLAEASVTGELADLVKLEKRLAREVLGREYRKAVRGPSPAKDVVAWRELSLCRDRLALQSLGPRAKQWLPEALAKEALGHCEAATKADRRNPQARAFESLGMFFVGEKKKAERQIKRLLRSRRRPVGWADLIAYYILRESGDEKAALRALSGAIRKRPGMLHARTTLGEHLADKGELDKAREAFEASLKVTPKQPWVLVQLGKIKAKQGDVDGALADTDKALALVPGDAVLLMEKASRLIDGERYNEAETVLREAMAQDPRQAAAYLRLGYVYLMTDQLQLAGPILQKALYEADRASESRIRGYAHYDRAKLYARLHDDDRAIAELGKAVKVGFAEKERFVADADLIRLVETDGFQALFPGAKPAPPKEEKAEAKADDGEEKAEDPKAEDGEEKAEAAKDDGKDATESP